MAQGPNAPRNQDRRDRREAWRIVMGFAVLLLLTVIAAVVLWPSLDAMTTAHLAPGLGLKASFAWGFGVTFAVFVVFAMVAGDGVFGELPIMLGAFLGFWVIFSLSLAWIF